MSRYITTPKYIQAVPENVDGNDAVIVVYRPSDTVKIADIKALADRGAVIAYTEVADRDDFLIFLGMTIPNGGEFVFLDPSLPVPKRFESVIRTGAKKPARKKSPAKKETAEREKAEDAAKPEAEKPADTPAKKRRSAAKAETPATEEPSGAEDIEIGMNRPEPADEAEEKYAGARGAWEKARAKYGAGNGA